MRELSILHWLLLSATVPLALWCVSAGVVLCRAKMTEQAVTLDYVSEQLTQPSVVVVNCRSGLIEGSIRR